MIVGLYAALNEPVFIEISCRMIWMCGGGPGDIKYAGVVLILGHTSKLCNDVPVLVPSFGACMMSQNVFDSLTLLSSVDMPW